MRKPLAYRRVFRLYPHRNGLPKMLLCRSVRARPKPGWKGHNLLNPMQAPQTACRRLAPVPPPYLHDTCCSAPPKGGIS